MVVGRNLVRVDQMYPSRLVKIMPAMQFSVGDVVKINSGGPVMTVEGIVIQDTIITCDCVWFISADDGYCEGPIRESFDQRVLREDTL